jgi:hypothetical protein
VHIEALGGPLRGACRKGSLGLSPVATYWADQQGNIMRLDK